MKDESQKKSTEAVQRLCSEIQLFDLCDLESCASRKGRFCLNENLLVKFESIKEEDETPDLVYDEDELLTDEGSDFEECDVEHEPEDQ